MRTFEEIAEDGRLASNINDVEGLLRSAAELMELGTPQAHSMADGLRGWAEYLKDDYTAALEHYHRALAIYVELGDKLGVARMIGSIGNIHDRTGDHAAALEFYHRALAGHEEINDRYGMARDIGNIAIAHYNTGDYPTALEHYHRALDIHEELCDHGSIAGVTSNIGLVYVRMGDYVRALENFQRALAIHEEPGNIISIAGVTGNIGMVYAKTGNYTAALEHYHRALLLNKEIGSRRGVSSITGNIVEVYLTMGSIEEARALFEALDAMQIDEAEIRVAREYHRATLQERSGDFDGAIATLQRALNEAIEHGLRSVMADFHKALRDLALKQNDLKNYVEHNNELTRITEEINGKDTATRLAMQEAERRIATERQEHQKHLAILHSTLPRHIADRVARGEQVNDHFDDAAVIFLDIAGFTTLSDQLTSQQVVQLLDSVFTTLDAVCKKHDVVKIKTIGDSYMAVAFSEQPNSRIPEQPISNPAVRAASAALDMLHEVSHVISPLGSPIRVRIGIHCGAVTAGVIGTERLQYDVWGDTVNVASRMESTGEPGRIHASEAFANALITSPPDPLSSLRGGTSSQFPIPYSLRERGTLEIKGKGTMITYWLENDPQ